MTDIPNEPVVRSIEDIVQSYGELDNAETRAQMPACHGHGVDGVLAQLLGELS